MSAHPDAFRAQRQHQPTIKLSKAKAESMRAMMAGPPAHAVLDAPVRASAAERYWTPFLRIITAHEMNTSMNDPGVFAMLTSFRCVVWTVFQQCNPTNTVSGGSYLSSQVSVKRLKRLFKEAGLFKTSTQHSARLTSGLTSSQFEMEVAKVFKRNKDKDKDKNDSKRTNTTTDLNKSSSNQTFTFSQFHQLTVQLAQFASPPAQDATASASMDAKEIQSRARAHLEARLRQYLLNPSIQAAYENIAVDTSRCVGGVVNVDGTANNTPALASTNQTERRRRNAMKAAGKLWSANFKPMASIFAHYASVQTVLRVPLPAHKQELHKTLNETKLLGLEDCMRMFDDFDLLGDGGISKTQLRTYFRNVKLWEVETYRTLVSASEQARVIRAPFNNGADLYLGASSLAMSLTGLVELLSRLAVAADLGDTPALAVGGLLHRIDLSAGKARLVQHSRKSTYGFVDAFQY